jgi:signal transduction histidine kinase
MEKLVQRVVQVLREDQALVDYELSLHELRQMLEKQLAPAAHERSVRLNCTIQGEGSLSSRNANILLLMLENLAQNAIEATPAGKEVQVSIRVLDDIEIAIKDQGPGLPEGYGDRLFAPCQSTKKGGSGIGLAISQQLAKHLGGEITLKRSSAEGCTFQIKLPLVSSHSSSTDSVSEAPQLTQTFS